MPDSIAHRPDSLAALYAVPAAMPTDTVLDTDLDRALSASYDMSGIDFSAICHTIPPPPPTWESGIAGTQRAQTAADSPGVVVILASAIVVMMLVTGRSKRIFGSLLRSLLSTKRHDNMFDERTSNEKWLVVLMGLQWCVYAGVLMYVFASQAVGADPGRALVQTAALIGLAAAYCIFQYTGYSLVGYAFTTPANSKLYVGGFTAAQSLSGFALAIPSVVGTFYPSTATIMVAIGFGICLLARLTFIIKGFRIFYTNFFSLFYFILYLCTLEIIPLSGAYFLSLYLVSYY